jgi:hypothetical protein
MRNPAPARSASFGLPMENYSPFTIRMHPDRAVPDRRVCPRHAVRQKLNAICEPEHPDVADVIGMRLWIAGETCTTPSASHIRLVLSISANCSYRIASTASGEARTETALRLIHDAGSLQHRHRPSCLARLPRLYASPVLFRGPARDDSLAFERVEERDHRGAVNAQRGRGFLLWLRLPACDDPEHAEVANGHPHVVD